MKAQFFLYKKVPICFVHKYCSYGRNPFANVCLCMKNRKSFDGKLLLTNNVLVAFLDVRPFEELLDTQAHKQHLVKPHQYAIKT